MIGKYVLTELVPADEYLIRCFYGGWNGTSGTEQYHGFQLKIKFNSWKTVVELANPDA